MNQTVFKYCNKKHNLALNCNTIRLGTLNYFRYYDNPEIGDHQEGHKTVLGYINDQEDKIPITHLLDNDSLIFSTTSNADYKLAHYDSCYEILDVQKFGELIADAIFANLSFNDIRGAVKDSEKVTMRDIANIGVRTCRDFVEYVDTNQIEDIRYQFNNVKIDNPLFNFDKMPFWKDVSYSGQAEYRFVFKFFNQVYSPHGSGIYFSGKDHFDINISYLKHLLPIRLIS